MALDGDHPGGRPYGYVIEYDTRLGPNKPPVVISLGLRIDPLTSAVVVKIFTMYADGRSPIAAHLNAQNIPSPRGGKWTASSISSDHKRGLGIIKNTTYIGRPFWNKSKSNKDPDLGTVAFDPRPREEWIEMKKPDLRIVEDELWNRVRARQESRRRSPQGQAITKALNGAKRRGGRESRYLLGGILRCGICGANIIGDGRVDYVCPNYVTGGCTFDRRFRRDAAHKAVSDIITVHLSDPAVVGEGRQYIATYIRERIAAAAAARKAAADGSALARIKQSRKAAEALRAVSPEAYTAALAAIDRDEAAILSAADVGTSRDERRLQQLSERLDEVYAERRKLIKLGLGVLSDDNMVKAREAIRQLVVDGKTRVHPDGSSGVRLEVAFGELGRSELQMAGFRRTLRNRELDGVSISGRGDRI